MTHLILCRSNSAAITALTCRDISTRSLKVSPGIWCWDISNMSFKPCTLWLDQMGYHSLSMHIDMIQWAASLVQWTPFTGYWPLQTGKQPQHLLFWRCSYPLTISIVDLLANISRPFTSIILTRLSKRFTSPDFNVDFKADRCMYIYIMLHTKFVYKCSDGSRVLKACVAKCVYVCFIHASVTKIKRQCSKNNLDQYSRFKPTASSKSKVITNWESLTVTDPLLITS